MTMTAPVLYDLVQCLQRVALGCTSNGVWPRQRGRLLHTRADHGEKAVGKAAADAFSYCGDRHLQGIRPSESRATK
jgi:hypothetical protein